MDEDDEVEIAWVDECSVGCRSCVIGAGVSVGAGRDGDDDGCGNSGLVVDSVIGLSGVGVVDFKIEVDLVVEEVMLVESEDVNVGLEVWEGVVELEIPVDIEEREVMLVDRGVVKVELEPLDAVDLGISVDVVVLVELEEAAALVVKVEVEVVLVKVVVVVTCVLVVRGAMVAVVHEPASGKAMSAGGYDIHDDDKLAKLNVICLDTSLVVTTVSCRLLQARKV